MRRKMIVLLMVMSAFCGTANAQLSDILRKVAGTASGNSTLSSLTGIISSKLIPTEKQIIGTWAYQEPAKGWMNSNS